MKTETYYLVLFWDEKGEFLMHDSIVRKTSKEALDLARAMKTPDNYPKWTYRIVPIEINNKKK